jgi:hypothetical protein
MDQLEATTTLAQGVPVRPNPAPKTLRFILNALCLVDLAPLHFGCQRRRRHPFSCLEFMLGRPWLIACDICETR